MRSKRLVVAVLVVALLVGLFSSIGLSAPRTVTMWSFAANNVVEWEKRKADIDKKFDINLKIETVAQTAFVQKLQAAMMDGQGYPDIVEWMIETNRILNADPKKSFVAPLDKFVKSSKVFSNVVPGRVAWVKYGGHTYGLPHDVHPVVLVYNDTLWKSVGVDLATIKTWDEFFAAAQKLSAEKKDGKPLHYALPELSSLNGTMFMVMQQAGAQILDKSGKPSFTNAKFKAFVEKWLAWYKTGTMCSWDWGNFAALLKNGTLAAYASPDWWVPQVDDAAKAGEYQFRVRALPLYPGSTCPTASWGGTFMAIVRLAKNQQQLYNIIEYMQYDEKALIDIRYPDTGMLPPFASIWSNDAFAKADARFGGQKLAQLQIEMAKQMPSVNNGDVFWDAIGDFNTQYTEMQSGKISVADGLKAAQATTMKRIKK